MNPAEKFTPEEIAVIADLCMLRDVVLMMRIAYPGHSLLPRLADLLARMNVKYAPIVKAWNEAQTPGGGG